GCTLVLEDITERKRYVRNMEFLARTAMELVDLPAEANIYEYIAERIIELVPGSFVFTDSYDENSHHFTMQAVKGGDLREWVIGVLGRDPIGLAFPVLELFTAPRYETTQTMFGIREYIFRPEEKKGAYSLYDVCLHQIPEDICEAVLDRYNIGKCYGIGLVWRDQLFGYIGVFLPPEEELHDREAFESFIRQASIAIARRQTEERLRRSERRLREVIESSPHAAALIDAGGRYTLLNRRFTDLFGYTLEDIPTGTEWFNRAFPDEQKRREAIAAWHSDLEGAARGEAGPRTFLVRCRDGAEKAALFRSVGLCDGTHYVTCEDVTEERRAYGVLVDEIAALRRQLASHSP
ncbi:MAG: PAS domain S-box protein, partial [Methanofollis liminatans]|nr:PAS domain S-box protein [Methanofollis liminatans]